MTASIASCLLATKYRVPILRPGVVARPRLLEALDRALAGPLTVVSAPAGFGKSTLLAGWAARRSTPVAWLSLDAGDTDMTRFLDYLIAALQVVVPGRGEAASGLLHTTLQPAVDAVLTTLINDLAEGGESLVAVLDDYHLVEAPEVQRAVAFLVEHLPAGVHLAIATRADPPLPLARWRARGLLAEVRAADLRFTVTEAEELLRDTMGIDVGEGAVAALTTRTEGWAAGLQLAALSLRQRGDTAGFVRSFAGSEGFILDYLIEEVVSRLPAATEDFLLRTSVLDRLCGPLCDAVTGGTGGAEALRALDRQNLFIEALDDERRWYRYHRLFADLLRHRLGREDPGLEPELHRRASAWHEEAGLVAAAVGHAVASGDGDRAARLVEDAAEATLAAGEFATLLHWVETLREEAVRARPALCAFHAVALFYAGRPVEQVQRVLAPAEAPGAGGIAQGTAAALRAVMATLGGDGAAGRRLAERAFGLLPPDRLFPRAMAGTTVGLAALSDGDPGAAERAFEETLRAAEASGNLVLRVLATRRLAGIAVMRGDLHQAVARYRQILGFTTGDEGRRAPLAALALIGLGYLCREWGDLDGAEAQVREGLELARRLGAPFAIDALVGLCRVLQGRGDLRGAATAIEEAGRLAAQFDATTDDDAYVAAMAARLHLAEGDVESAAAWAEERGLATAASSGKVPRFYPGEMEWATLARLLLCTRRPEAALAVVEPLLAEAQRQGRHGSSIELETLRALAFDLQGEPRAAAAALGRALAMGAPHGHLRTFLDEGEPLARLLRRALDAGVAPPYGRVVLAAFGGTAGRPSRVAGLAEPLTDRERRVLRHLPTTLSVPEIARELYVAPSTVRSHVKAIYRKLGVTRRTEAVERARVLGLL